MDIMDFMEGVAARLGNARPPSYDDLDPHQALPAALSSVQDAINDEIEERRKTLASKEDVSNDIILPVVRDDTPVPRGALGNATLKALHHWDKWRTVRDEVSWTALVSRMEALRRATVADAVTPSTIPADIRNRMRESLKFYLAHESEDSGCMFISNVYSEKCLDPIVDAVMHGWLAPNREQQ